jgi:DNA-binding GntR family transcriptional regulator
MEIPGLTKAIVNQLRADIITGKLAPGQKLNEIELSSRLQVSRPPLREAFRVLEGENLVFSIPRKGSYVTPMSKKDLRDVYQAREMIECFAIDLLEAKNIRDLPQVASALAGVSNLSTPPDMNSEQLLAYQEAFAEYHSKLVESPGNTWIVDFYRRISSGLARYEYGYFSLAESTERSSKDHHEILRSIENGDYHNAKRRLKTHIEYIADSQEDVAVGRVGTNPL